MTNKPKRRLFLKTILVLTTIENALLIFPNYENRNAETNQQILEI